MRIPYPGLIGISLWLAAATACGGGSDPKPPADTAPGTATDADADGLTAGEDCDDNDPEAGAAMEWYLDTDGDGFGIESAQTRVACEAAPGYTDNAMDCDDSEASVHPEAVERCDSIDNNCDGSVDGADAIDGDTWCEDADEDGWGNAEACVTACSAPAGYTDNAGDCDDGSAAVGTASPTDEEHCGECDNSCLGTESCIGGECVEECTYPEIDIDAATGSGAAIAPTYVGVGFAGFLDDGLIHDGYVDGEEQSSYLQFIWYDAKFNELCSTTYDASLASPASLISDGGATIWESWLFALGAPEDACPPFDAARFGYSSADDFVQALVWGVGIGEMSAEFESELITAVEDAGLDWATDWEPYVTGMHISFDGSIAYDIGYAFHYETQCDEAVPDKGGQLVVLPKESGAPLMGLYEAPFFYVFSL